MFVLGIPALLILFQYGRTDSYRVATVASVRDDNKTADGKDKV